LLVLALLLVAPMAAANEGVWKAEAASVSDGPMLSAFINVWLETNVGNYEPAIAYNSRHDEYLVVWSNTRGVGTMKDIYARRVRGDGTLLSRFTIASKAGFHYYEPDVAYSPDYDEYLVAFTYDSVTTGSDIWARRVSWNGSWMSTAFALGRPNKDGDQHSPAVVYNSRHDEYLVVYQNTWGGGGRDVDAQRVRAGDGSSPGWVNVAAGPGLRSFPDVTYNHTSDLYLIAYNFRPSSPFDPGDIFGKVASWNFGDLSPEIHICDDASNQGSVAVAASGEEFLAVWEDSPSTSTTEIYARRLAADGTPLGSPGGFWIAGIPGRHDYAPAVASGAGHRYLIAWERFMGGLDYNIYGRYATAGHDSAVGSEFALDNDVRAQMAPAVACATLINCMMAEEDNNSAGGDFEIRARIASLYGVYLPVVVR